MGEEIAFQNGPIYDFQGLVTLTLDRVILHTVMHHSSISTYMPNVIKIKDTFCGRTDGQTFETHFMRSTRSQPINSRFESPFWEHMGITQTSSMARWKTHCRLPISNNL